MEESYFAPITNSTLGDIRDNQIVQESGAFVFEVAVWIVASAPFLSDTDCWNASQPTIPLRARNQVLRRESLGHRIKIGSV
jgi:hypothetical protein